MIKAFIYRLVILIFLFSFLTISPTNSIYSDTETSLGNTFTAGCWAPPSAPVLKYPANNAYVNSSWDQNPFFEWQPSSFVCPGSTLTYIYQSAYDSEFRILAATSSPRSTTTIPSPSTPENTYYWHVKACDSHNRCSDWSSTFKMTVDRTAPHVKIDSPSDLTVVDGIVDIFGTVTDANPHHYWLVIQNSSGQKVAGPGTINSNTSFTNVKLFSWNTAGLPEGEYKIKLEARDAADNKNQDSVHWINVTVNHSPPEGRYTRILSEDMSSSYNSSTITVPYEVLGDAFNHVELCYSFNLKPWVCPGKNEFKNNKHATSFEFKAPEGDGLYQLITYGYDGSFSDRETKNPETDSVFIQIDTTPPSSNLDFTSSPDSYTGQNLIRNGQFSGSLTGWTAGTGSTLTVGSTGGVALTGGYIYQDVYIPSHLSSTLMFDYNFQSDDIIEHDHFNVRIIDNLDNITEILHLGNPQIGGEPLNTGWHTVARSLINYAGSTIRLWFGLTDTNPDYTLSSQVLLNNITLSTLDPRLADTFPVILDSHDNLSGLLETSTPSDLESGENTVIFSATDIAGNSSVPGQVDVVVLGPVVINKVAFNLLGDNTDLGTSGTDSGEWVELKNISQSTVNLSGWNLNSGTNQNIDIPQSELSPGSNIKVFRSGDPDFDLHDQSDTVVLLNNTGKEIDKTNYQLPQTVENRLWLRTPEGLGPWSLETTPGQISANIAYRPVQNRITLTIDGISDNMETYEYDIFYQVDSLPDPVNIHGDVVNTPPQTRIDRDFFLGTCSSYACLTHTGIGQTFTLVITVPGQPDITQSFTR